jgi:hypothetical protein
MRTSQQPPIHRHRRVAPFAAALVLFATAGCATGPVASPADASFAAGQSTPKPKPTPVGIATPDGSASPNGSGSSTSARLPVDPDTLEVLRGPWTATPIALPPPSIPVVDLVCRTMLEDALAGYELAAVDARGEGLVNAFYVGTEGGNYGCENLQIDPSGELLAEGFGSGMPSEPVPQPDADEVIAWYGTHQEAPRSMLTSAGLVGANVSEVRFTADGKPAIVATVMNGWFAMWLPDDWARLTLRGYDADGVEVFSNLDW